MKAQGKLRKHAPAMIFLLPTFLVFSLTVAIPFLGSIYYSLTDWNGVSKDVQFVALKNYVKIFSGKSGFMDSVQFTTALSLCIVALSIIIGTLLALFLTSNLVKCSNLYRAVFYVPNMIGGVTLGFIWQFIFILGFPTIGDMIGSSFLSQQWLGSETGAFTALLIVNVWKSSGYVMLVMIAAFMGINREYIEAAQLDGCGFWKTFFKIKLPLSIPYITVSLFWSLSNAFKMFELNYVLTEGGPYGSTVSMALNIYNNAFTNNKYGLACAESIVFFIIVMIVTSLQLRLTNKAEERRS